MEQLMQMQLIMLMRIYDVIMLDMTERKPELANRIYAQHNDGKLLSPPPWASE